MIYRDDWIIRQIEMMAAILIKLIYNDDIINTQFKDEQLFNAQLSEKILSELYLLISQGIICGAENKLFEQIDTENPIWASIAVKFYKELNKLSDVELEAADFSRDEILSGIKSVARLYGVDDLTEC